MTYREYLDKLLAAGDKSKQEDILWQAVLDAGPAPFDVLEDYVSGRLLE